MGPKPQLLTEEGAQGPAAGLKEQLFAGGGARGRGPPDASNSCPSTIASTPSEASEEANLEDCSPDSLGLGPSDACCGLEELAPRRLVLRPLARPLEHSWPAEENSDYDEEPPVRARIVVRRTFLEVVLLGTQGSSKSRAQSCPAKADARSSRCSAAGQDEGEDWEPAGGLPGWCGRWDQDAAVGPLRPKMPSLGSKLHATRRCKPCAFFHGPLGCESGLACGFCHLCPPLEKRRRQRERNAKKQRRLARREGACLASLEVKGDGSDGEHSAQEATLTESQGRPGTLNAEAVAC